MNRLHATKDFWLAALRADGPAFQAAVAEAGPEPPCPSCPGWTVADLAEHVDASCALGPGAGAARRDRPSPRTRGPRAAAPAWPDALDGLRRELTGTIETLDALDPELPAWNWAAAGRRRPGSGSAGWPTSSSVHRWDAQSAAGRPGRSRRKLAADGVNEVLDTWLPAGRRKGPTDLHGVVHLVATDASYEWFVRLRGAGRRPARHRRPSSTPTIITRGPGHRHRERPAARALGPGRA